MRERFGVNKGGGIRPSLTSTDVILVRSIHSDYNDIEEGRQIIYDGKYYDGPNQMISGNLKLAVSRENGNRVLYFVKENGRLVFNGLVEYVRHYVKDDPARPGAIAYELEMVDAAVAASAPEQEGASAGRHSGLPSPRAPSAPDLDMIMEVEHNISEHRRFAGTSELLATLHAGIDPAKLGRILEYLESSGKISTGDGSIRWTFSGAGTQEDTGADGEDNGVSADAGGNKEPVHILSMEERLSTDLDNDLPYSEDLERVIAERQAGRATGKVYTIEEYLKHLDQEFSDAAAESPHK